MTHAHTQAPWGAHFDEQPNPNEAVIYSADDDTVCVLTVDGVAPEASVKLVARARLIAAAPALLAALEKALERVACYERWASDDRVRSQFSSVGSLILEDIRDYDSWASARAALEAAGPQPSEGEGLSTSSAKGTGGAS